MHNEASPSDFEGSECSRTLRVSTTTVRWRDEDDVTRTQREAQLENPSPVIRGRKTGYAPERRFGRKQSIRPRRKSSPTAWTPNSRQFMRSPTLIGLPTVPRGNLPRKANEPASSILYASPGSHVLNEQFQSALDQKLSRLIVTSLHRNKRRGRMKNAESMKIDLSGSQSSQNSASLTVTDGTKGTVPIENANKADVAVRSSFARRAALSLRLKPQKSALRKRPSRFAPDNVITMSPMNFKIPDERRPEDRHKPVSLSRDYEKQASSDGNGACQESSPISTLDSGQYGVILPSLSGSRSPAGGASSFRGSSLAESARLRWATRISINGVSGAYGDDSSYFGGGTTRRSSNGSSETICTWSGDDTGFLVKCETLVTNASEAASDSRRGGRPAHRRQLDPFAGLGTENDELHRYLLGQDSYRQSRRRVLVPRTPTATGSTYETRLLQRCFHPQDILNEQLQHQSKYRSPSLDSALPGLARENHQSPILVQLFQVPKEQRHEKTLPIPKRNVRLDLSNTSKEPTAKQMDFLSFIGLRQSRAEGPPDDRSTPEFRAPFAFNDTSPTFIPRRITAGSPASLMSRRVSQMPRPPCSVEQVAAYQGSTSPFEAIRSDSTSTLHDSEELTVSRLPKKITDESQDPLSLRIGGFGALEAGTITPKAPRTTNHVAVPLLALPVATDAGCPGIQLASKKNFGRQDTFRINDTRRRQPLNKDAAEHDPERSPFTRTPTPANFRRARRTSSLKRTISDKAVRHKALLWRVVRWPFRTNLNTPRRVVTSLDVERAREARELRAYVAAQLDALPLSKRELVENTNLRGWATVLRERVVGRRHVASPEDTTTMHPKSSSKRMTETETFRALLAKSMRDPRSGLTTRSSFRSSAIRNKQTSLSTSDISDDSLTIPLQDSSSSAFPCGSTRPKPPDFFRLRSSKRAESLERILTGTTVLTGGVPTNRTLKQDVGESEIEFPESQVEGTTAAAALLAQQKTQNPYDKSEDSFWSSNAVFTIAVVASNLGKGHLSQFPFYLYYFNGAAFILTYLLVGLFCAVPFMAAVVGLGQLAQGGSIRSLHVVHPRARGIAVLAIIFTFIGAIVQICKRQYILLFGTVWHQGYAPSPILYAADLKADKLRSIAKIIFCAVDASILMRYLANSFQNNLPWKPSAYHARACHTYREDVDRCFWGGRACTSYVDTCFINPYHFAKEFHDTILSANSGGNLLISMCLLVLWAAAFVMISRDPMTFYSMGVWSVAAYTVCSLFLFAYGLSVGGSSYSLSNLFEFLPVDFFNPYMWGFCTAHVFTSLGLGTCLLFGLAGRKKPQTSIMATCYGAFFLSFLVSILSSLSVFPFFGFVLTGTDSSALLILTRSADYILYSAVPLALSFLPGAPVFCLLFFTACVGITANASFARMLFVTKDLLDIKFVAKRCSKAAVGLILVILGLALSLSELRGGIATLWIYVEQACDQIGSLIMVFLISFCIGWIDSWEVLEDRIGRFSMLVWTGTYLAACAVFLLLNAIPVISANTESLVLHFLASLGLLSLGGLLAVLLGIYHRTRHVGRVEPWSRSVGSVCWWLFLGNVTILRADLNDLSHGPPPVVPPRQLYGSSGSVKRDPVAYARQMQDKGVQIVRSIKIIDLRFTTLYLQLLITKDASFGGILYYRGIGAGFYGDPSFGLVIHGDMFDDPERYHRFKMSYFNMFTFPLIFAAITWLFPGFLKCIAPTIALTHLRKFRGHYDLTISERIHESLKRVSELQKPNWGSSALDKMLWIDKGYKPARKGASKTVRLKSQQSSLVTAAAMRRSRAVRTRSGSDRLMIRFGSRVGSTSGGSRNLVMTIRETSAAVRCGVSDLEENRRARQVALNSASLSQDLASVNTLL